MTSKIELKMHDGWHIPRCPINFRNGPCPGFLRAVGVRLDELHQHRVKDTRINLGVKKFTCGHEIQ